MSSPERLTRIAGLLYEIEQPGGVALGYLSPKVYAPGDAATTAAAALLASISAQNACAMADRRSLTTPGRVAT